uniref:NADH dehydrogenase subunit 6 n=1 Tax=Haplothrips aculeatus TaxID=450991 RepID=A0A0H3VLU7_9NEOP|nr:NADH dehydrogenase subunit 6 [Haplothrips aculeatus]AKE35846.1 NADH dehydrogenase subunit 6 [Haplothrips aculeatus]
MNYIYLFIYWFWIIMIIFFLVKHPLIMGLLLILNTFFLCIFILLSSFSSWNSYILFLMFLGGVLILFLYNISLITSEMFFYILVKDIIFFFFSSFFFIFFSFKESFLFEVTNFFFLKNCLPMMFLFYNMNTMLFLMIYLFLSLVCVINLIYLMKDKGSFFNFKIL